MAKQKEKPMLHFMNLFCILFTIIAFFIACYCGSKDLGLIDGSFGPGSYYYSDIPGWEKIFLSDKTWHLGFGQPVLALAFFVIWGVLSFRLLLWLDRKIK